MSGPTGGARRTPWRLRPSTVVLVGAVVVAVLLLGVAGTSWARWNASATLSPGSLGSGRLDVGLDGQLAGSGGSVTVSGLGLGAAAPAESVAREIVVGNTGEAPLAWTALGSSTGSLSSVLLVSVHPGGTASNSGTAAAANRRGTCSGTATFGPAALTSTPLSVVAVARRVNPGASERLCVVVALSASAPTGSQGASATPSLRVDAVQVAR